MNAPIAVAATLVTPLNCVAAVGQPWRALKRWAQEHQIPIHKVGRRPCIRLDRILSEIEGGTIPRVVDEAEVVALAAGRRR